MTFILQPKHFFPLLARAWPAEIDAKEDIVGAALGASEGAEPRRKALVPWLRDTVCGTMPTRYWQISEVGAN